jgi:hypothetical protein
MRASIFVTAALAAWAIATSACAEGVVVPRQSYLQVASTRDLNAAIGIARLFAEERGPASRVLLARNGWYAVAVGPMTVGSVAEYVRNLRDYETHPPKDAFLTSGSYYTRVVWSKPPSAELAKDYFGEAPVTISAAGLTVTAAVVDLDAKTRTMRIVGADPAGPLFTVDVGEFDKILDDIVRYPKFPDVTIVRLDNATRYPQIVVTNYSGGAHCCTDTSILTEVSPGKWQEVYAGLIQWGYSFEDLDRDGAAELLWADENFVDLYGYGPDMWIPTFTSVLSGAKLTKVTHTPRLLDRNRQDLAGLEFLAALDASLWHNNRFLGEWVASKALVGELAAAWDKAMRLYDRSDLALGYPCRVPFPAALAEILGYGKYGRPPYMPKIAAAPHCRG